MSSMDLFVGYAKSAIDGKGRCAFPREFRRQMTTEDGTRFVLTRWPDHKLMLFVEAEYHRYRVKNVESRNFKEAQALQGFLRPTFVDLDGQNRILLPKEYMNYAALSGSVTFAEAHGKSLELWNSERYDAAFSLDTDENMAMFENLCFGEVTGGSSEQK